MPKLKYQCDVCREIHFATLTDEQAKPGTAVRPVCPRVDRRYRLTNFFVNSVRSLYNSPVGKVYADADRDRLRAQFGTDRFEEKFERWKNIDYPPIGLIDDDYPLMIEEVINAYTFGYSYAAVTSCCCLAERILNRLVLKCRHHFRYHASYKRIHRKDSFDDWALMIRLIEQWQLVPEKAIAQFRFLMPVRRDAVHYNRGYDFNGVAAPAINALISAISETFGVINRRDIYLVFDVPGEVWVRSAASSSPFVKEFVLPHCYFAHAVHDLDWDKGRIVRITERLGKVGSLTDEEFVALRKSSRS